MAAKLNRKKKNITKIIHTHTQAHSQKELQKRNDSMVDNRISLPSSSLTEFQHNTFCRESTESPRKVLSVDLTNLNFA